MAAAIKALTPILKGKTVGAQTATIQADLSNTYLKDVVTIRTYKTTEEHDLDLSDGPDRRRARLDLLLRLHPRASRAATSSKSGRCSPAACSARAPVSVSARAILSWWPCSTRH